MVAIHPRSEKFDTSVGPSFAFRRDATGSPPAEESKSQRLVPAVEFREVDFSYDDKKILDGLSFKLGTGEIKIILSGSGGGKSTILKLILGLLEPDAGEILVDGEIITGRAPVANE